MRTSRLITAGFAAAVALGLLAIAQPGNANTETTDNQIASPSGVVIFAVQSRAPNIGEDGNALAIYNSNTSAVNLLGWSVEVVDSTGATTASHTFGNIDLLPGEHYVLHSTGFTVNPINGQVQIEPFDSQPGPDEVPQVYQASLFNDSGALEDLVATANTASITPEGGDPAPQLTSATDHLNAFIRRDELATDTDNNRDDFTIACAKWGTP